MKPICPKCKSLVRDKFSGEKKVSPRWKTLIKGMQWECRHCGYVLDKLQQVFLEKKEKEQDE